MNHKHILQVPLNMPCEYSLTMRSKNCHMTNFLIHWSTVLSGFGSLLCHTNDSPL